MIRKYRYIAITLSAIVFLCGCTELYQTEKKKPGKEVGKMQERGRFHPMNYLKKAYHHEKKKEWKTALNYYRIAAELGAKEAKVRKKISDLSRKLNRLSRLHYKKGVTYYLKNRTASARNEFLTALYYNPENKKALDYLKNRLHGIPYAVYQVKEGQTLTRISRDVYNTPEMSYIIAYFNDIRESQTLRKGALLKIPSFDVHKFREEKAEKKAPENPLDKARSFLAENKYAQAASIAESVLAGGAKNPEAREIKNISYFEMSKYLLKEKQYQKALTAINQVDPDYKETMEIRKNIVQEMNLLAEEYYRNGVKYYIDEDLPSAIRAWEKTLELNPEHEKAKRDMENAQKLLEKWEKVR